MDLMSHQFQSMLHILLNEKEMLCSFKNSKNLVTFLNYFMNSKLGEW